MSGCAAERLVPQGATNLDEKKDHMSGAQKTSVSASTGPTISIPTRPGCNTCNLQQQAGAKCLLMERLFLLCSMPFLVHAPRVTPSVADLLQLGVAHVLHREDVDVGVLIAAFVDLSGEKAERSEWSSESTRALVFNVSFSPRFACLLSFCLSLSSGKSRAITRCSVAQCARTLYL